MTEGKVMLLGDALGSMRNLGACCGCQDQFMSTHERVYVPRDEERKVHGWTHGDACLGCARKAGLVT